MKQLDVTDQSQLLVIARRSIETAVRHGPRAGVVDGPPSAGMEAPAAAFVTIHEHGQLRGCIGLMRFEYPLWQNVRDAAAAAALDDPRFLPVDESELPALELEVSVLDPPAELPDPAGFVAGRHGIVVERGMRRALLLPQVATEMGWDEKQMLEAVCRKANLPGDSWRDPSTKLFVFESRCFSEADLAAASAEPPAG
ncbi:MAG: AmmeMemoRadiSam system protein A [Candidatus Limnocylindrales bacterium]